MLEFDSKTPFLIILFSLLQFSLFSRHVVGFEIPVSESFCTCDLLIDVCDVDCCCDPNCNANLFSKCLPIYPRNISQSCSKYIQEDQTSTRLTMIYNFSLLCIYKNNYLDPYFYTTPKRLTTIEMIDEESQQHSTPYHFSTPSSSQTDFKYGGGVYRADDIIQTVFRDSKGGIGRGVLTLPHSNELCTPRPLAYMEEKLSSCVSAFKSRFETSCQPGSLLDARRYFKNFNISSTPSSNVSVNIEHRQSTCLNDVNDVISCSFNGTVSPTFNGTEEICRNAVKEVRYDIEANDTFGVLTRMLVSFVFQDVSSFDLPLTQTFKVKYFQVGEMNAVTPVELPQRKSSSYEFGQAIMAGQLRTTNSTNGSTLYFVDVNSDSSKWVTMAMAGKDGRCSEGLRKPIVFGVDMQSGCFVEFTMDNISRTCVDVSNRLVNIILPGLHPPTHVARYANSNSSEMSATNGWIPIQNNTVSMPQAYSNEGGCVDMVDGLIIEIAYERTGYIGELTTEISRITYFFTTRPSFRFPCPSNHCPTISRNSTERAEFTARVTFVDESTLPTYRKLSIPKLKVSLPEDFFYPFNV